MKKETSNLPTPNNAEQAMQTILFTLDEEGKELGIEDYLKLLQELQANISGRIITIRAEVYKKNESL